MFNIQNQEQENHEFSRHVIIPAFPSRAELKFDGNTTTIMRTFLLHIFTYDWARGVDEDICVNRNSSRTRINVNTDIPTNNRYDALAENTNDISVHNDENIDKRVNENTVK